MDERVRMQGQGQTEAGIQSIVDVLSATPLQTSLFLDGKFAFFRLPIGLDGEISKLFYRPFV